MKIDEAAMVLLGISPNVAAAIPAVSVGRMRRELPLGAVLNPRAGRQSRGHSTCMHEGAVQLSLSLGQSLSTVFSRTTSRKGPLFGIAE